MSSTMKKPRSGYDKDRWGEWFDKHILMDWRFGGSSFHELIVAADKRGERFFTAEVMLGTMYDLNRNVIVYLPEFSKVWEATSDSIRCDLWQMFSDLSHYAQQRYSWDFVQHHTDRAREMFYEALDVTEPEYEEEAQ